MKFFSISATFTPYSSLNFRYTEIVKSLFERQEDVTDYKQFWDFIENDLVEGLYWETWYNRGYERAYIKVNTHLILLWLFARW